METRGKVGNTGTEWDERRSGELESIERRKGRGGRKASRGGVRNSGLGKREGRVRSDRRV